MDDSSQSLKYCPRCQITYPATPQFFHACKNRKDGLNGWCKTCRKQYEQRPIVIPDGQMKCCSKCQKVYPATNDHFSRDPLGQYGLRSTCKNCDAVRRKAYYDSHRAETKAYTQAHKEESINRNRTWRAEHRDRVHARDIKYRERYRSDPSYPEREKRYRDNSKERRSRYQHIHRERYTAHARTRRARQHSISGTHTPQQIREQYERQYGKCYYCQHYVEWGSHHVDHTFPISRVAGTNIPANDIGYLVTTCRTCNLKKGDKFPWEFYEGGRLL